MLRRTVTSFGSVCFGAIVTAVTSSFELAIATLLPCCICDLLLRYVNRYAFVQVATYGKSYCKSARSTLSLFRLYDLQAVANDNLTVAIMFSYTSIAIAAAALLSWAVFSVVTLKAFHFISLILTRYLLRQI